jgi:hypothetical protein
VAALDNKATLDLSIDDVLGVWQELELALAGKNGYGGDVAEIYAYRLVPTSLRHHPQDEAQAQIAGRNMTFILRRFAESHEGAVVAIQHSRDEFRALDLAQDFPAFDWRVHLRVTQERPRAARASTQKVREAIAEVAKHNDALIAMLDELAAYRAKERLHADAEPSAATDDLPPDAATGLYLDRPFDGDDFTWIKMAFETYVQRHDGRPKRASQIMLVLQAIHRNERATREVLRVMNTIVLPLLRRLRLKEHPHLTKLGAAGE